VAHRPLSGVLLVGGASRRFGSRKALARYRGTTLAEHAWSVLGEACDERFAFGKAEDGLELPFPVLDDGIDVRAPIAGVVAGLRAARHDVCMFLPVDTPLVTPAAIRLLADACRDAAVPNSRPLPAVYSRAALPVLEPRLREGRLALHAALDELDTASVTVDSALLANVNQPDELAALRSCR
jgi:molybdopterin-guanine dinucleotide biosynthesis protein A